jgi:hypothetical protein
MRIYISILVFSLISRKIGTTPPGKIADKLTMRIVKKWKIIYFAQWLA